MKPIKIEVQDIEIDLQNHTVSEKLIPWPKGEDWKDGETPTDEKLLALILPNIPKPKNGKDGKSITKTEVKEIVKEVLPEEKLIEKIVKKIPKPKDGQDGKSFRFADLTAYEKQILTWPQGSSWVWVPRGGTANQKLIKSSSRDFDTEWADDTGGGGSVSVNWAEVTDPNFEDSVDIEFGVTGSDVSPVLSDAVHASLDLADSATQPWDLATVATTGSYNDLSDKPTIPTGTIDGTLTTNELVYSVDSNTVGSLAVATYPSLTEISYVKGVTSAIQTQLNAKQATLSVSDTSEIDLTLSSNTLSASIVSGSIDETKLDTSVNDSLDLADSALQPSDIASGTITARADDINFSGGSDGDVLTVQADGSLALETPSAGGNVSKVGTPVNNQIGVWTGDGTIEGDADLTFDTSTNTLFVGAVGLDARVQVHAVKSDASDWLLVEASNGTDVGILGAGNTANATWYWNHNFEWGTISAGKDATTLGKVKLFGSTSWDVTIQPNAVAGTGVVLTAPATTGTIALTSDIPAAWANTALSNLSGVAINTTLVSDTDETDDLGTTLKKWLNIFVKNIGATATRVTKGWFTDLESTNMPTVWGTPILSSLTAPQFTTIELWHASDTTLARASAWVVQVEWKTLVNLTDWGTFAADISVPDEAYGSGWNGSTEVPTKNAIYDKIETLGGITSAVRAYLTTSAQTVSTWYASRATVQFNAESFDVDWEFNTWTYTFTAAATGKYQLNIHIGWNNWSSADCELYLVIGGVENLVKTLTYAGSGAWTLDYSDLISLAATDTVSVKVAQYTGSNRNINTWEYVTNFSIKRVS